MFGTAGRMEDEKEGRPAPGRGEEEVVMGCVTSGVGVGEGELAGLSDMAVALWCARCGLCGWVRLRTGAWLCDVYVGLYRAACDVRNTM
jgi:hypothetical protein